MSRGSVFAIMIAAMVVMGGGVLRVVALPPGGIVSIAEIVPVALEPGDTALVEIPFTVARGYHIQANPAAGEFLIPAEVHLDTGDDMLVVSTSYPAPARYRLEGTSEDLLTYHGSERISVHIAALTTAKPGKRLIKGTLHYQACDSTRCFFPASLPIEFTVEFLRN